VPSQGATIFDREALDDLGHHVVHEGDADGGLAARGSLDRCRAGLGVLVDVLVQALLPFERLSSPNSCTMVARVV
jgi:hypothetical protein